MKSTSSTPRLAAPAALAVFAACAVSAQAALDLDLAIGEDESANLQWVNSNPANNNDIPINATDNWNSLATKMSSYVKRLDSTTFEYKYKWETDGKGLSHIIVELTPPSPSVYANEALFNAYKAGFSISDTLGSTVTIDYFEDDGNSQSNPQMPSKMFGVKLDLPQNTDAKVYEFSIRTSHSPVLGDFYAKDGKIDQNPVRAFNSGFTANDTDVEGNPLDHIIVPNGIVPEPSTYVAAALLGIPAVIGFARTTRRRQPAV